MPKEKRLSQVAKELNVGINTIADFLTKKNLDVEIRPNAKIESDIYKILLDEFSKDKIVKTESEKISQKKQFFVESKSFKEEKTIQEQTENNKANVSIKENEVPAKNEEKSGPKIVGKINLDELNRSKKATNLLEKKIEEKIEEIKIIKEEIIELPIIENTSSEDNEDFSSDSDIEDDFENESYQEDEIEDDYEEDTTPVSTETGKEDGVKILGKIDLSTINQQTRPRKKRSRNERKQERIKREQASKDIIEKAKEDRDKIKKISEITTVETTEQVKLPVVDDNFIRTKVETLTGPTVVGRIELKKEKTEDTDRTQKRRRRRRKRLTNAVNKEPETVDKTKKKEVVKEDPAKKKVLVRKKKKKTDKVEVSEEDVKSQVKATLAKLTEKKKKTSVKHRKDKREEARDRVRKEQEQQEIEEKILRVTEFISAKELSSLMDVSVNQVISTCFELGKMVQINQRLDAETISIVAEEYGFEVDFVSVADHEAIDIKEENEADLKPRAPIVTVMGHVDHGKTSLLDYIRDANVIAGEAGGITQHIGAYSVEVKNENKITFLDTPGHEAFTAMRARGAQITDVAIIVIAATDSIMPQTREAINHAQAAQVPIVFAINKIDLPGAKPERIKQELAEMNLLVEEWGGKYQSKDISAKHGNNVDLLLDEVILASEILELKANPDRNAIGTIIESSLDKGRGFLTTVIVQTGTLKVGDVLHAGPFSGRVKAIFNERNKKIDSVRPSEPALILGLNGAPQSGIKFRVTETEKEARTAAAKYHRLKREQTLRAHRHITLDEIGRRLKIGNFQELKIIVKGDFDGSIEAISDALIKLSTDEIQVKVIHQAVGQISEADVMLASASDAVIIGFQVRPSSVARKLAEKEDIEIRLYSVIYNAIEDLKDAMEGMLSPEIKEEIMATVEVRQIFNISKVGKIAGCYVLDGKIVRDSKIRLIRDGVVVHTGHLASLKRMKDDVKDVSKGYECGLNIEKFNEMKEGDIIEAYHEVEVAKKL